MSIKILTRADMYELLYLLNDIIKDNKQYPQANSIARFSAMELRMAQLHYPEGYELANFSKWTQDFIKEVRANEA